MAEVSFPTENTERKHREHRGFKAVKGLWQNNLFHFHCPENPGSEKSLCPLWKNLCVLCGKQQIPYCFVYQKQKGMTTGFLYRIWYDAKKSRKWRLAIPAFGQYFFPQKP